MTKINQLSESTAGLKIDKATLSKIEDLFINRQQRTEEEMLMIG